MPAARKGAISASERGTASIVPVPPAAPDLLDQPPALGHQLQGVLEGEDAGEDGRRVLAEAVAEHGARPHPPGAEQAGEGDLDGEQGRLGDGGARQLPRRLRLAAGLRVEDAAQVEPQAGREELRGAVDLGAEDRLGVVEVAPHPDVLRALAGEDEGHRPPRLRPAAGRARRASAGAPDRPPPGRPRRPRDRGRPAPRGRSKARRPVARV